MDNHFWLIAINFLESDIYFLVKDIQFSQSDKIYIFSLQLIIYVLFKSYRRWLIHAFVAIHHPHDDQPPRY